MKATLHAVTWHIPHLVAEFSFKPEGRFRFVPGEYTELYVAHAAPDERGQSREFSIASTPNDSTINIITAFSPAGTRQSTFKQALRSLRLGDEVDIAQPRGDFVLPKDPSIPVAFIAGGIGIVPVLSIVGSLAHTAHGRYLQVLHSASSDQALLGRELLAKTSDTYIPVITTGAKNGLSGRITGRYALDQLHIDPQTLVYLAGPEGMIRTLKTQLLNHGVSPTRIVVDEFSRYDP